VLIGLIKEVGCESHTANATVLWTKLQQPLGNWEGVKVG